MRHRHAANQAIPFLSRPQWLWAWWLLLFFICASCTYGGSLINHKSAQTPLLSTNQLSDIFTLKQKNWANGLRIRIVVLKPSPPEYVSFVTEQLGIFPYQLNRHWKRLNFSGRATAPKTAKSVSELLTYIANTPGAIGYIPGTVELSGISPSIQQDLQRVELTP